MRPLAPGIARRPVGLAAGLAAAEVWFLRAVWAALAIVAALVVVTPGWFALPSVVDDTGRLLAAAGAYALSHVARLVRLAVLIAHPGLRLRRVAQVHLLSSGLSLLLPFKLGELVRIREVGVITGRLRRGILAVWLERALDACFLLILVLLIAVDVPDALDPLTPLLVVMTAFVSITVVLITVLPENLRWLMLHIVRRPFGERSVPALRLLRATLATLHEAPAMLRGRLPTLVLLSAVIWTCEVIAVSIAIPGAGAGLSDLSSALLSLLSSISSGATALMPSFGDRLAEALGELGRVPDVGVYRTCLAVSLLVAGAVAAGYYVPWRARRTRRPVA